jgi:hypothetical protein
MNGIYYNFYVEEELDYVRIKNKRSKAVYVFDKEDFNMIKDYVWSENTKTVTLKTGPYTYRYLRRIVIEGNYEVTYLVHRVICGLPVTKKSLLNIGKKLTKPDDYHVHHADKILDTKFDSKTGKRINVSADILVEGNNRRSNLYILRSDQHKKIHDMIKIKQSRKATLLLCEKFDEDNRKILGLVSRKEYLNFVNSKLIEEEYLEKELEEKNKKEEEMIIKWNELVRELAIVKKKINEKEDADLDDAYLLAEKEDEIATFIRKNNLNVGSTTTY